MERFVIVNHNCEVSVLDTGHELVEEEGNLLLFGIDYANQGDADYLAYELEPIVRLLNEQDRIIRGLQFFLFFIHYFLNRTETFIQQIIHLYVYVQCKVELHKTLKKEDDKVWTHTSTLTTSVKLAGNV